MTAEEVLNVLHSKEISDNGGGVEDHHKIVTEHCNGKEISVNGNVGGEVVSDIVDSDPIVTVDVNSNGNGVVVLEDHKVEGESEVTVISNSNGSVDKTTIVDVVEREGEIYQNGSGSDVNHVHVTDNTVVEVQNGALDKESSECAVESSEDEIRDEVSDSVVEEGVKVQDRELESFENGVVEENEICDVVADVDKSDRELEGGVVENGAVDTGGGDVEEIEVLVPVVVEEVAAASTEAVEAGDSDVVGTAESKDHESGESEKVGGVGVDASGEKTEICDVELESEVGAEVSDSAENKLESVVDAEVSESAEKNEIGDVELESEVDAEVSDSAEKKLESVVDTEVSESAEKNEICDVELETSVDAEVSESAETNGIHDVELETVIDAEVSESAEKNETHDVELESVVDAEVSNSAEKNEIPVDVNGVCDDTDVKQCAVEDTQNGLEKAPVESVSDTIVENGVAEVEVSECTEGENVILVDVSESERSVEVSEPQVVIQGKDLAEKIESGVFDDADEGKDENEPSVDTKTIEEEGNAAPSDNVVKVEGESIDVSEIKTDAVESEAEHSKETVVSEAEPSTETVASEAEASNNAMESEASLSVDVPDLKTNAVDREAELSTEAEPPVEAESPVEAEPSVEAKISAEGEGSNPIDEDLKTPQEVSSADATDAQNLGTEVVKTPFYWLVRVPRYDDDENIREQIQHAAQQVEEKTKIRDEIRSESQDKRALCKEYGQEFRAALQEERAARELLKAKRQEMDSVQSIMSRLNNAISVGDIDAKIRNMEHMIQHETLPLKEEKQLIRQIKQLKQTRGELSTIIAKQDQSQSLDDKESIEEQTKRLQLLRKELDVLRNNVLKAETITKAAKKKSDEESNQLSKLMAQYKAADDTRQEAFVKLQILRRQLHEKSKYFWEYKNASVRAQELGAQRGKKEEVQKLCIEQAERIHEMLKNDEFRRSYIRCNTRSTLRRLVTYDGRGLGPDEEPPVIPNAFIERSPKNDSLVPQSTPEQQQKSIPTESVTVNAKDEPTSKVAVQKPEISESSKAKKPAKPVPEKKSAVPVSRWGDESDEDKEPKEPVRTKEEEERILKAEKVKKEEEEAKLKEIKRLEEIEKAKEALQRKKRNAEKAQQRALYKAQKEAEQKEKEREKRARKKEKRKTVSPDHAVENTEQESAALPTAEILTRTLDESDQIEKPAEVTKRPVKPSQFTKQNKVKSLPMAIRNRGKRRIQPWMWWALIAVLVIAALFYIGNNSSLISSFQSFGF
ncbi:plectin [Trifolium pratense]|uniref:plectin n=1 Tax=Trifolium pratense TaxID=57577 RepID=UPI001E693A03|nr:plectin [Trifolium pratense]